MERKLIIYHLREWKTVNLPLQKGGAVTLTFAKTSRTVIKNRREIVEQLTGALSVTITETIELHISAPFPLGTDH